MIRERVVVAVAAFALFAGCNGPADDDAGELQQKPPTTVPVAMSSTTRPVTTTHHPPETTTTEPATSTSEAADGASAPEPSTTTTIVASTTTSPTTTTVAATTTATVPPPSSTTTITTQPSRFWSPQPGAPWQWQLTEPVDRSADVPVYDIDLFENSQAVIDRLHADGRKVICYVVTGAWESYRPDAADFPDSVIGNSTGWEGERWLDIRQIEVIGPIIASRLDLAASKDCDAVEPDQNNGWENDPGFPITRAESIRWNIWVARAAHDRGLSVGLKNSITETAELEPYFDWALNEECFQYDECDLLQPFIDAGKAVLQVEYATDPADFCPEALDFGFSSMKKHLNLDAWRHAC